MSNRVWRPPLGALLVQAEEVVGALDLPAASAQFVEEFNRMYDRIGLRVEPIPHLPREETPWTGHHKEG